MAEAKKQAADKQRSNGSCGSYAAASRLPAESGIAGIVGDGGMLLHR